MIDAHDRYVDDRYVDDRYVDDRYIGEIIIEWKSDVNTKNRTYLLLITAFKDPLNIFHGTYNTDYPPIRLSYHHGNHYNSIVDPNNPSVGVGLGLPAYKPGVINTSLSSSLALLPSSLPSYFLPSFSLF
jgi:hypothetical protein